MCCSSKFQVFKNIILSICVGLAYLLIYDVIQKNISGESFTALLLQYHEKLMPPVLTICPGPGFKNSGTYYFDRLTKEFLNLPIKLGPFLNREHLQNSSYSAEELFHPRTLKKLQNKSLYNFKEQYSSYYGLCFVIEKLAAEGVSDYSFEVVVNDEMDYNCMLSEPDENEWMFMSVFPYDIHMKKIDVNNNNNIGGASKILLLSDVE